MKMRMCIIVGIILLLVIIIVPSGEQISARLSIAINEVAVNLIYVVIEAKKH